MDKKKYKTLNKRQKRWYAGKLKTREYINFALSKKHNWSANFIYGLCNITWGGNKGRFVATSLLFGEDVNSYADISSSNLTRRIKNILLGNELGLVNFYKAYRNTSYKWIKANRSKLALIFNDACKIRDDADILAIANEISKLPSIPKPKAKKQMLPCINLISPVIACIDPTGRFPIINRNPQVVKLHRKLGIEREHILGKVATLLYLMNVYKLENSLKLDLLASSLSKVVTKELKRESLIDGNFIQGKEKVLPPKEDEDTKYFRTRKNILVSHTHNYLTNILIAKTRSKKLKIYEGENKNKYDALIKHYDGHCNLLIEVKGSVSSSEIRIGIGQLFDYKYRLNKKNIDLAMFLPKCPDSHYKNILGKLGIRLVWCENGTIKGEQKVVRFLN